MYDCAPQTLTSNMTAATLSISMLTSRALVHASPQLDLPHVLPSTTALYTRPSMHTVVDCTPAMVNDPQFSMMTGDRRNSAMLFYTVPPAALAVVLLCTLQCTQLIH